MGKGNLDQEHVVEPREKGIQTNEQGWMVVLFLVTGLWNTYRNEVLRQAKLPSVFDVSWFCLTFWQKGSETLLRSKHDAGLLCFFISYKLKYTIKQVPSKSLSWEDRKHCWKGSFQKGLFWFKGVLIPACGNVMEFLFLRRLQLD